MTQATLQRPEVTKADPRLIQGEAISKLIKTEEFKIFMQEVSNMRSYALASYISQEASESNRQRVLAFDEIIGLPNSFQRKMNAGLAELR